MNSDADIEISLNGTFIRIPCLNLADLIRRENPEGTAVAAAINGEFVPRSQHNAIDLRDGDLVDLVSPVGGG